jgi:hypothetical protein
VAALAATGADLSQTPLDRALSQVAAVALLGCAVWLWGVTSLVVLEAAEGARTPGPSRRGVPAGVRRAVLSACGVALVTVTVQPAQASGSVGHPTGSHGHRHSVLDGLPLPDRAVAGPPPGRPAAASPARTVLVRAGDTLWSIAARDLPPGSPDARVAAHWRAIYAANRDRIGADPDVIVPGARLTLPGKDLP